MALIGAIEDGLRLLHLLGVDDDDETDSHVERAQHLILFDVAELLEMLEERWHGPACQVHDSRGSTRQNAGQVLGDATSGDMSHAADQAHFGTSSGELFDDREVAPVSAHEGCAGLVLELVDVLVWAVVGDFEEQLAGERVAVGMQPVGGQADQDVANFNVFAGDDVGAVDAADDGACEFVLTVGVEAGHLCCLASDEGAAIGAAGLGEAANYGFDGVAILFAELAGGEVVEEKKRCGTLHGDVVDAVIDEVRADRVMYAEFEGDLEFSAHAIRARDEDRLGKFLEVEREEAAEATDFGEDVLVEGLAGEHLDALLGAVARRDVDACRGVGGRGLPVSRLRR